MNNLAVHMRISGIVVSDNDVESRRLAAKSLAAKWGKVTNVHEIIAQAGEIAVALSGDGIPSKGLCVEVQSAIQKKSPAYLADEQPFDVGICSGLAMVSLFEDRPRVPGWTTSELYAVALWSALSYQPPLENAKREALRVEVLNAAATFSTELSEEARRRIDVPDPSTLKSPIDESNAVTIDFKTAMSKTIDALRDNAALDREELDFLWWAQLGRSRLLKKQLSELSEATRIVAAGIEGAKMLRRLPCEVHREIVLRTLEQDDELDLTELLSALGDERIILSNAVRKDTINAHPSVFPLLHAICTGSVDEFGSCQKRSISEWGGRALLEAALVNMVLQGVGKV